MGVAQTRTETAKRLLYVLAGFCLVYTVSLRAFTRDHVFAAEAIPSAGYDNLFGFGRQSVGLSLGHGYSLGIGGGRGTELEDVQFLYVAPRWGVGISNPIGGNSWVRGNFEFVLEGAFYYIFEPKDGVAGGVTPLIRYNFLTGGRLIPFVQFGVGLLALDANLKPQSDGLNFTPQGGVGMHYFISDRTSITGEWRLHHISNASIHENNLGINSSLFMIGLTYFLR
jgi:lipid A 3-O-deacylase